MNFFEELFDELSQWLSEVWDTIVKTALIIWSHFQNLFDNIMAYFTGKQSKYANKQNIVGLSIKLGELIDKKQFNSIKGVLRNQNSELVMNVMFDKDKKEILENEDIQIIETEKLDQKAKDSFGDKPLLIIE